MKYKEFKKLLDLIQKQDSKVDALSKLKIDVLDFVDPYHMIMNTLIKEIYGENGLDWFSWYVYENDMGKAGLEAWDEKGNKICYDIKSVWEFLEQNKKL